MKPRSAGYVKRWASQFRHRRNDKPGRVKPVISRHNAPRRLPVVGRNPRANRYRHVATSEACRHRLRPRNVVQRCPSDPVRQSFKHRVPPFRAMRGPTLHSRRPSQEAAKAPQFERWASQ